MVKSSAHVLASLFLFMGVFCAYFLTFIFFMFCYEKDGVCRTTFPFPSLLHKKDESYLPEVGASLR